MATDVCGYSDCEFVETPPNSLVCLICTFVSKDPQQLQCCGRLCCKACLTKHVSYQSVCPVCRSKLKSFADKRSERDVNSLLVKCRNSACDWIGELQCLSEHDTTCNFSIVPCPNKCDDKLAIKRVNLEKHLSSDCPRRHFKCPRCKESGEFQYITTSHSEICPGVIVPCPNGPQCKQQVKRHCLGKHRMTCAYEKVACKYAKLGCGEKLLRGEIMAHEDNSEQHLKLAMDTVVKLEDRTSRSLPDHRITFKVSNFSDLSTYDSPPFYTHSRGYKLCIKVKMHVSRGESYVSVFAHLMKGEFDDCLEWPFKGKVTMELLNQLEDAGHFKQTIDFLPGVSLPSMCLRVFGRERSPTPNGYRDFIAEFFLEHDADFNCQYLKDDCLYFRVGAEASFDRPWLMDMCVV